MKIPREQPDQPVPGAVLVTTVPPEPPADPLLEQLTVAFADLSATHEQLADEHAGLRIVVRLLAAQALPVFGGDSVYEPVPDVEPVPPVVFEWLAARRPPLPARTTFSPLGGPA